MFRLIYLISMLIVNEYFIEQLFRKYFLTGTKFGKIHARTIFLKLLSFVLKINIVITGGLVLC